MKPSERRRILQTRMNNTGPLYLKGMHGLGDNLHQRAIIRQFMAQGRPVYLESSWVSVYWDLIEQSEGENGLKVLYNPCKLAAQVKNAERERSLFSDDPIPIGVTPQHIWWRAADVRKHGSVLGAMLTTMGLNLGIADFRLPIHPDWPATLMPWLHKWQPKKPIMIFRPLIERTEWSGCAARNPDYRAYADLYMAIREHFFVVSIADLTPQKEWTVGIKVPVDVELHRGELPFETLAALFKMAALTYCSPGFSAVLSQAVQTPVVCVFGGYENSTSFSLGARYTPYLGIDPIDPCDCFLHSHDCKKEIDVAKWIPRLTRFAEDATGYDRTHVEPELPLVRTFTKPSVAAAERSPEYT